LGREKKSFAGAQANLLYAGGMGVQEDGKEGRKRETYR
jgi:hypothetical protein